MTHFKKGFRRFCSVMALTAGMACSEGASAEDFRLHFPPIYTMSPLGVNLQTGRFEIDQEEFSIGPLSVNLRYTSTHRNEFWQFPTAGSGGENINIEHPANGIARSLRGFVQFTTYPTYSGTSMSVINVQIGDTALQFTTSYVSWNRAAVGWKMQKLGSNFVLTNKSGDVYTFAEHTALPPQSGWSEKRQVLSNVVFSDGHRLDYSYGLAAQMTRVTSNRGYAILLDYAAASSTISVCGYNISVQYIGPTTTCAGAPIKTVYGFSSPSGYQQLTSITDVSGGVINLTYGGRMLACITLVGSATCKVQNIYGPQPGELITATATDQVRKQTTATGEIWLYNYRNPPEGDDRPPLQPGEVRTTYGRMFDPLGNLTVTSYQNGIPASLISPAGTTNYSFNGLLPEAIISPEGNSLNITYDGLDNITTRKLLPKAGSPLAGTTETLTYPPPGPPLCNAASQKLCDKPHSRVDERGNQSDFTYDPAHGGILTETAPAVNGIRAQTRYTYLPRYAWIKNAAGAYIQAASPVWLLTSKHM